jgi:hypothetical protein
VKQAESHRHRCSLSIEFTDQSLRIKGLNAAFQGIADGEERSTRVAYQVLSLAAAIIAIADLSDAGDGAVHSVKDRIQGTQCLMINPARRTH